MALPRGVRIRDNRQSKSLQITFAFRGVTCREVLRLDPSAANVRFAANLLGEIKSKIAKGTFNYGEYFPDSKRAALFGHVASRKSLGDLLDAYLAGCEKACKLGNLSPATINGYRKIVRAVKKLPLGKIALRDLSPLHIREYITGLDCTAKTARNSLSVLRAALDDAVNDGLIAANPIAGVAVKRILAKTARKSDYEVDPFTAEEKAAIIESAAEGHHRNLIRFGFFSGLRTSELIALEWRDIAPDYSAAHVCRAVVRKTVKGTKTEAGNRVVELQPEARQALQDQAALSKLMRGRVFLDPKAGAAWETDAQLRRRVWLPAITKAGVRYRRQYNMRHTYASALLSSGANPWWVAEQMGHEDISMLIKHYGRFIKEDGQRFKVAAQK